MSNHHCLDENAVELRDAAVDRGGHRIWEHVDLAIPAGEFVAVLGPNGVGKSTLIQAVLGELRLAHGTVAVFGADPRLGRDRIGYLPQRRNFPPTVPIRGIDIVTLGLTGHRFGISLPFGKSRRETKQRVAEALDLVGASAYARRAIGQVSGGEQQRLLIAQALVAEPRLLLLDEPLDSLDLPNQAVMAGLISEICRSRGVTVLMVAHDVNPIITYLDRVVYLGTLGAVSGPPSEVINSETLSRLYQTPVEVLTASDGRLVVVGEPEAPHRHSDRHAHSGHTR